MKHSEPKLRRMKMAGKDVPEGLMTVDELASYLSISTGTIYNRVSKGEIPFVKVGAAVRFRRSEIDRWVEEQAGRVEQTPAEEPAA